MTESAASIGARVPSSATHALEAIDPPIPMVIFERGLKIRWISSAAIAALGLHAERLIGRSWYELFPQSRVRAAKHERLFTGELAALDVPRVELNLGCGRIHYFSLRLRPLKAADGSIEAVLGIGEDITPQVQAEAALRDNEDRFRTISTHAHDLILITDRSGVLSFANHALESVLGHRPEERLGRSIFESMHPEDATRVHAAFTRLVEDSDPADLQRTDVRVRRQDGGWRWLQFTATNLLNNPRVAGVLLSGRDVTERKEAELAFEQVQARLEAALWGARMAVYSTELPDGRTQVSPQFFEITGLDPARVQAHEHPWITGLDPARIHAHEHPWRHEIHARDRRTVLERMAAHLAGKTEAFEAEYRLRTPRGWLWILERARVMSRDTDGRPLSLAGTLIDISGRKDLEREMSEIASREQQRLSQDLHDGLGQELAGIALLLSSVVTRLKREPGAPCAADLDLVIAHMNNSIRNARAMAHGLHPVSADEGGLVGALTALAANSSLSEQLQVEFDSSGYAPRALPEDIAQQIYRIGQEALSNSMRHAGGSRVLIRLSGSADALELSVRDNGRGLSEQVRNAPGLGRKIMNYRAQLIGGSIAWHPVTDGGTEVLLQVPLSPVSPP